MTPSFNSKTVIDDENVVDIWQDKDNQLYYSDYRYEKLVEQHTTITYVISFIILIRVLSNSLFIFSN